MIMRLTGYPENCLYPLPTDIRTGAGRPVGIDCRPVRMKALRISAAGFLLIAATPAVAFDCEIVPFTARSESFRTVYEKDSYKAFHERKEWEVLMCPRGGYIGKAIVRDESAVGGTARMSVRMVTTEDLLDPVKRTSKPFWFEEMGLYDPSADSRKLLYEHTWEIDKAPFTIEVWLPGVQKEMARCELEISDAQGGQIYSCVPAEVFYGRNRYAFYGYSGSEAWILSDDEEADRRLKEFAKIQSSTRYDEVPLNWRHYIHTSAIWVGKDTDIPVHLLRRIILSGCHVFGNKEGLRPHLEKLGIPECSILTGGINVLENWRTSVRDMDELMSNYPPGAFNVSQGQRFQFANYSYHCHKTTPMEDNRSLFEDKKLPFMTFTLITAGLYALGSAVLLPILFLRAKGTKRVGLWWKTPLAISAYTALIAIIGTAAIHPKEAISDVTEYRLGYGDWPEVFCNVNAAALKYGGFPYGWHVPPGATRTYFQDNSAYLSVQEKADGSTKVMLKNAVRANRSMNGFGYFKMLRQPFTARAGDRRIEIQSDREVRNVYVRLSCGHWINLGRLAPGETAVVENNNNSADINVPSAIENGLNNGVQSLFPLGEKKELKPCPNCGKIHKNSRNAAQLIGGCIVVIAVDEKDKPSVAGLQKTQSHTGRVAWICQVPVEGRQPGMNLTK